METADVNRMINSLFKIISLSWWTVGDSNPRPRRCERRALPIELTAHFIWKKGTYNLPFIDYFFHCLREKDDDNPLSFQ